MSIGKYMLEIMEELFLQFQKPTIEKNIKLLYKELLFHCNATNIQISHSYKNETISDVLKSVKEEITNYINARYSIHID
jgi:hypothetical protein